MGDPMLFLAGLAGAVALTPLARRVGLALGLVDRPDDGLKIHPHPVPVLGGVAVIVTTVGAMVALGRPPSWSVAGAVALALATGVADDVRPLPAWLRAMEILADSPARQQVGRNTREPSMSRLGIAEIAPKYLAMYEEVVARISAPPSPR
jgi:hypothetical protein